MTKLQSALNALLLTALTALCATCTADSIATEDLPTPRTGVLRLRMASDPVFVQVDTRAVTALTDFTGYVFTLSDGTEVNFTEGQAIIPAGTYTLTATNAATADAYTEPVYSGTSGSFTLTAGGTAEVSLTLTPQNSKVSYTVSDEFKAAYTIQSFTVGTQTLTSAGEEKYIPAGSISYEITARANLGSHVQEFSTVSGTLTAEAGKSHPIHLDINPITGYIKIDSGDPYSGEFQ